MSRVLLGGTHTSGLTANALVVSAHVPPPKFPPISSTSTQVLSDSVYLELISFTHPVSYYPEGSPERKARETNVWASKSPGWIDYAFLGNGSLIPGQRISDAINKRIGHPLYSPEAPAGRVRPDGKVLKWVLSSGPCDARGTLPFFCGDVTPRKWRVRITLTYALSRHFNNDMIRSHKQQVSPDPAHANHPSTAQGIAYIRILTSPQNFDKIISDLTGVIGDLPTTSSAEEATWKLDTGHPQEERPSLILSSPTNAEEVEFVTQGGTGIHEVAFRVGNGKGGTEKTPYGKIRWVPDE